MNGINLVEFFGAVQKIHNRRLQQLLIIAFIKADQQPPA